MLPQVPDGFDVVLGDSWFKAHSVTLDYGRSVMCLRQGRKVLVIKAGQGGAKLPQPNLHRDPDSERAPKSMVLSALQFKKELRRAGRKGEQAFLLVLRNADMADSADMASGQEGSAAEAAGPVKTAQQYSSVVEALKAEFADVLVEELPPGLPPERAGVPSIIPTLPGAKPPNRPLYRMSPREVEEVKKQVTDLLSKGLITLSSSPYASPVLFVPKKDGSLRMCVDYRVLNKITVKNSYPLPLIEDLINSMHGCFVFSTLDLCSGYWQLRLSEEEAPKTAFKTPMGLYEFKVLPFGLANAPSAFAATMGRVFSDLIGRRGSGVLVYLDDILVYSRNAQEHEAVLREVLTRLRQHQLHAKGSKCCFFKPEVTFLGHVVGGGGIKPDPKKVQALTALQRPKSLQELRSFLGLANYFRRFMKGYAKEVGPLLALTRGKYAATWTDNLWGPAQQKAFDWVKATLASQPVLTNPDLNKPFVVTTDASVKGIGAVLEQEGPDGKLHPVAYESRKLTDAETRYHTTEQEMLAVVHALRTWRCFLEGGAKFLVRTDHNPKPAVAGALQQGGAGA